MKNSYKFFENFSCKYYPCHKLNEINCLWCYCPLFYFEKCKPGRPVKKKDCSKCLYPHKPENYDKIIKRLKQK